MVGAEEVVEAEAVVVVTLAPIPLQWVEGAAGDLLVPNEDFEYPFDLRLQSH